MKKQRYLTLPLIAILGLLSYHLIIQMDIVRTCTYYPVVMISIAINVVIVSFFLFDIMDLYREMMISMQMMIKATVLVYSLLHCVVILCIINSQDIYFYLEIELVLLCAFICLESSMIFLGRRRN